jgi:hypothetical protein
MPFLTGRVNAHQRLRTRGSGRRWSGEVGARDEPQPDEFITVPLTAEGTPGWPRKKAHSLGHPDESPARYARTFAELRRRQAHAIGVIAKWQ